MSPGGLASAKVAVAGGGQIGVGWAIVFARAGFDVAVYEPAASRRRDAPDEIETRLGDLDQHSLLEEPPAAIRARIVVGSDLEEVVRNAVHVQECAPERLDIKVALFKALDGLADPGTTLGSSSSAMTISQIAAELPGRSRCLLAHPGNPPYLIRVVELAPAPFTAPETVDSVRDLFSRPGWSRSRSAKRWTASCSTAYKERSSERPCAWSGTAW